MYRHTKRMNFQGKTNKFKTRFGIKKSTTCIIQEKYRENIKEKLIGLIIGAYKNVSDFYSN